jgi:hypothetical protein
MLLRRVASLDDDQSPVIEGPNATSVEITIDVRAAQLRNSLAVINEATCNGAEVAVRMLDDRLQDRRRPALALRAKVVIPFLDRPAVVAAFHDLVDHLPQILADFAAPAVSRLAIEAEAPQLPETIGVDLRMSALHVHEGIALRHAVALARRWVVHVNPQHLREDARQILADDEFVGDA